MLQFATLDTLLALLYQTAFAFLYRYISGFVLDSQERFPGC
jgi:hypothetical protein